MNIQFRINASHMDEAEALIERVSLTATTLKKDHPNTNVSVEVILGQRS